MAARSIDLITTAVALSLLAQQPPPTIRSRTTLVPVDVRVIDSKGRPVTDLKREDFTLQEDGKPQVIRLFDARGLEAQPADAAGSPLLRTGATETAPVQAQNRRIFLFLFGRGRLQAPDKGIDAVMKFVRERLLPQDRVAVLAYNRATDFTGDRAAILATLDRFKKAHEQIEADIVQYFSSLRAIYGAKTLPNNIQKQIDAVFRAPGGAAARQLPTASATDAGTIAKDTQNNVNALQRADVLTGRDPTPFDAFDTAAADFVGMGFDEYTQVTTQSTQDLNNIYTGIKYLRYLEGEKHLVFVTERGLLLPRLENDYSVAALASDARVVIDTLMTGGIILSGPGSPGVAPATGPPPRDGRNLSRMSFGAMFASGTQRSIAGLTGGLYNGYTPSEKALAAIDQSSTFEYLLGYVPENAAFDGTFRRIAVKVTRPGVQVLFRHGYYARRDNVPFNRQEFMTYSRVAAAANTDTPLTDLAVSATAAYDPGAPEADLTVTLKADRIAFGHAPGHHTASVQIAMFAGDGKQRLLGEHWQTMSLDLTDADYQTFMAQGASFTRRIPVQGSLKYVKVIAYDYASDRVGTALVIIPAQ
jgi:VWFA-related protein